MRRRLLDPKGIPKSNARYLYNRIRVRIWMDMPNRDIDKFC